jgi:hypothetical protein
MTQRWERGKEAGFGTRLIKEEEGVRYGGAQGGHPMCGTAEEGGGGSGRQWSGAMEVDTDRANKGGGTGGFRSVGRC